LYPNKHLEKSSGHERQPKFTYLPPSNAGDTNKKGKAYRLDEPFQSVSTQENPKDAEE
jgi:hypothetical protein